jgi:hypothetical protein
VNGWHTAVRPTTAAMDELMRLTTPLPCQDNADEFTTPYPSPKRVNDLAAAYCDPCPVRGLCYRAALGDETAWGLYGGVWFHDGVPVPASAVTRHARRTAA